MLVIRLARIGTKNRPSYRIIICERGRDNYGNVLEILGTYNTYSKELKVEGEKVKAWISKGAQLSPTLNNLLVEKKIIEGKKTKSRKANTVKLLKKREDAKKAENDAKIKAETDKLAAAEAAKAALEAEKAAKEAAEAAPAESAIPVETIAETPVEAPVEEVKAE